MQIPRIHSPGPSAVPSPNILKGGRAGRSGESGPVSHEAEVGGAVNDTSLEQLTRRFRQVSEVRSDVVAEARVRLQRGDYLTRAVSEQIADSLLSKDA